MRYPASEKLEIIRLVEESHLSARLTLAKLGIPRTTFYRWYDRYLSVVKLDCRINLPSPNRSGTAFPMRYGKSGQPSTERDGAVATRTGRDIH